VLSVRKSARKNCKNYFPKVCNNGYYFLTILMFVKEFTIIVVACLSAELLKKLQISFRELSGCFALDQILTKYYLVADKNAEIFNRELSVCVYLLL